jgi:transaldolase
MLLIDTADLNEIAAAQKLPAIHGFTTNPALMAQAAHSDALSLSDYTTRANDLCEFACRQDTPVSHIMIQGVGSSGEIVQQAVRYSSTLKNSPRSKLWMKLTPTSENLALCPELKALGCSVLVTAVFTAAQAYLSVESGADGVAVYVGRLMRFEQQNWQKHLEQISTVMCDSKRLLLLASFRDLLTVNSALEYSRNLTVPPHILQEMFASPYSRDAIKDFDSKVNVA